MHRIVRLRAVREQRMFRFLCEASAFSGVKEKAFVPQQAQCHQVEADNHSFQLISLCALCGAITFVLIP